MQEKHHNGFMLGLVIGAAVGALVSTKKGREILKDVADYGLEYVGNIINLDDLQSVMDEEDEMVVAEAEAEETTKKETVVKEEAVKEEPQKPQRRRLFRGIRRKS